MPTRGCIPAVALPSPTGFVPRRTSRVLGSRSWLLCCQEEGAEQCVDWSEFGFLVTGGAGPCLLAPPQDRIPVEFLNSSFNRIDLILAKGISEGGEQ